MGPIPAGRPTQPAKINVRQAANGTPIVTLPQPGKQQAKHNTASARSLRVLLKTMKHAKKMIWQATEPGEERLNPARCLQACLHVHLHKHRTSSSPSCMKAGRQAGRHTCKVMMCRSASHASEGVLTKLLQDMNQCLLQLHEGYSHSQHCSSTAVDAQTCIAVMQAAATATPHRASPPCPPCRQTEVPFLNSTERRQTCNIKSCKHSCCCAAQSMPRTTATTT
jgi:hypothetical protein